MVDSPETGRAVADFLSAEQFMRGCDFIWSTDKRCQIPRSLGAIPAGAVLYAKVDHWPGLFKILKRQRSRVVLVTSESDLAITPEIAAQRPPQVAAWFSTNTLSPFVRALPLGFANSYCQITLKAADLPAVQTEPTRWLYVNFRPESLPAVRQPVWDDFAARREDWITLRRPEASSVNYGDELRDHRFVLCPRGNGIDTHRMWEALACGVIPVVEKDPALDSFADLPILFVKNFRQVSKDLLEEEYRRIKAGSWCLEKLTASWWHREFRRAQVELRAEGSCVPWPIFARTFVQAFMAR